MSAQRGVARRIPYRALLVLATARQLHLGLGIAVRDAVQMATQLLAAEGGGVHASGQLRVVLDRPALEQEINQRLRDALESAPSPRRGRPPGR